MSLPYRFMPYSLQDFLKEFPDDEACVLYIYRKKYKDYECPRCKKIGNFYQLKAKGSRRFACSCGYGLSPQKGTIFYETRLPLRKWFMAIYLLANSTYHAPGLQKVLGISYPAAFKIQTKIFQLMLQNVKDNTHLARWRPKAIAFYHRFDPWNVDLYLGSFQYREEREKNKEEPFFHLLDKAIQSPPRRLPSPNKPRKKAK